MHTNTTRAPAARPHFRLTYWANHYQMYLLLVPGLLFLAVYKFVPLYGLQLAFKDYHLLSGNTIFESIQNSPWVGLKYFRQIFASKEFTTVFFNTLIISLYKIFFLFPLPILLAILLNEIKSTAYKKVVQTILYLPHFLSWIVVFGLFFTLLGNDGVINTILMNLGLQKVSVFTNKSLFRPLLIVSDGWKESGWGTIVYLAAITTINPELYEAAMVDGAKKWRLIWHITLPGLLPIIVLMLVLRIGNLLNAGFEQVLAMYNPAVYSVADIIDTYVYRKGLGQLNFSLGTATGLFNSLIAFILVFLGNFVSGKLTQRSIW